MGPREEFLRHLRSERNLSPHTVRAYGGDLDRFIPRFHLDNRVAVRINDADLIGCPIRVTVGEKGLKEGMVELKLRKIKENQY